MSFIKQCGVVLLALLVTLGIACEQPLEKQTVLKVQGSTMGTSYHVTAIDAVGGNLKNSIDSLLLAINREVNTYDSTSFISRLNRGEKLILPIVRNTKELIRVEGGHFSSNLSLSLKPISYSLGAFDPTVGPLTEYYGFGATNRANQPVVQEEIERLLEFVGFSNILIDTINEEHIELAIARQGVRLDLSAIAKGYAVDQVAHLLAQQFKSKSYFVEIGGETRTAGKSPRDGQWTIGVNKPLEDAAINDLELILGISDKAIATSGNYRNRRIIDGKAFVHTIDPQTGIAKASSLLSATVIADDCATADAFATACMASAENAEQVLAKAELSACLIYAKSDSTFETRYVGGFDEYVLLSN